MRGRLGRAPVLTARSRTRSTPFSIQTETRDERLVVGRGL